MFFYFLTELVAFLIAMGEKCPAKAIKWSKGLFFSRI